MQAQQRLFATLYLYLCLFFSSLNNAKHIWGLGQDGPQVKTGFYYLLWFAHSNRPLSF
jgi:hypothetical protein